MCVTWMPISSMWPITASEGPSPVPGTRTDEDPMPSTRTSSENALTDSRQMAAGPVSWPDGPGARSSVSRSGGVAMAAELIRSSCAGPLPRSSPRAGAQRPGPLLIEQLAQHELEDPAVAVVALLLGG